MASEGGSQPVEFGRENRLESEPNSKIIVIPASLTALTRDFIKNPESIEAAKVE
jgi:hypothetical protein